MNFLRMEKWLADRPHHPGEAAKQWLKDLYQENRLVEGSFVLSGRQVDLKSIAAPVLNVFALDDHIIPPDCSRALGAKIKSRCPAAMWASSSRASRRESSVRASPTGCLPATPIL
jgi:polyhydroxyalkanoate synthase